MEVDHNIPTTQPDSGKKLAYIAVGAGLSSMMLSVCCCIPTGRLGLFILLVGLAARLSQIVLAVVAVGAGLKASHGQLEGEAKWFARLGVVFGGMILMVYMFGAAVLLFDFDLPLSWLHKMTRPY